MVILLLKFSVQTLWEMKISLPFTHIYLSLKHELFPSSPQPPKVICIRVTFNVYNVMWNAIHNQTMCSRILFIFCKAENNCFPYKTTVFFICIIYTQLITDSTPHSPLISKWPILSSLVPSVLCLSMGLFALVTRDTS